MNFDFMKDLQTIQPLYGFCADAEEFAISKPDFSVGSARKAIEFIVRLIYSAAIKKNAACMTVFDMLCDPTFVLYLDDRTLLDAIHIVRKKGNMAVHQGGLSEEDARETLEKLHFIVGEVCIFLGLLTEYPAFHPELVRNNDVVQCNQNILSDEEPDVAENIINSFLPRLEGIKHYTQLRRTETARGFIDVHFNPAKFDELEKEKGKDARFNTSTNVRTAFEYIFKWIEKELPGARVTPDYRLLQYDIQTESGKKCAAVRMGCANLGRRKPDGEWAVLPGIDYIFYTYEVDPTLDVPGQFRVFKREEFLQMWQDLGSIKFAVSSTAHKRLKEILGPDEKLATEKYADTMAVQQIKTSRKKTRLFEEYMSRFPGLSPDILKELC